MDLSSILLMLSTATAVVALLVWLVRLLNEVKKRKLLAAQEERSPGGVAKADGQPTVTQVAGRDNHYIDNRGSKG